MNKTSVKKYNLTAVVYQTPTSVNSIDILLPMFLQIADIVSSFGGKLSHDESISDAELGNLLEGTSIACQK